MTPSLLQEWGSQRQLATEPTRRVRIPTRRLATEPPEVAPAITKRRFPCPWCEKTPEGRRDKIYCSVRCRQASWRFGVKPSRIDRIATGPRRIAYADPPYPGKAGCYEEKEEVDSESLLEQLRQYDGWALSTSQEGLREIVPSLTPAERIGIWIRRTIPAKSYRALNAWEPLIYRPVRALRVVESQTVVDVLDYRGRYNAYPGAVIGMKPPQFSVWMFQLVAAVPGDTFDDLYPGSGAVSRAWTRYTCTGDESQRSSL